MKTAQRGRQYKSKIRELLSIQTREFIMQAIQELLSKEGLDQLTMRNLAQYSGISIRTLYRYFPDKATLIASISPWVEAKIDGPIPYRQPDNVDELVGRMTARFRRYEANPELIRTYILSKKGEQMRKHGAPDRAKMVAHALENGLKDTDPAVRQEIIALTYFLISANAWEHFRDTWTFDPETSSRICAWAIRVTLAAAAAGDLPNEA